MLKRGDLSGQVRELVALKDSDLIYRACSVSYAQALGFESPNSLIGKSDVQLFPLDRAKYEVNLDARTLQSGKPEISNLVLDSGQQFVSVRVPVTNTRGDVTGIDIRLLGGTEGDINTSHDAQQSAFGSYQANTTSLGDTGLQGSLVIRGDVAVYANETAAGIFGFATAAELTQRPSIVSLFPKEEWPRIRRNMLSQSGPKNHAVPMRYKLTVIDSDGKTRLLLATSREIPWNGQSAILLSLVGIDDVVPELGTTGISDQRYKHYAKASADFFWELDEKLRFSFLTEEFGASLGLSVPELIGQTHENLLNSEGNINGDDIWESQLQRLNNRQPFRDFEFRWKINDDVKMFRYSGIPVYDSNNVFMGYRGTGRDVSAANKFEESLTYHANHDALTGLVNRRHFEMLCEKALRGAKSSRASHALCFMDLDSFKIVNDTCGHLAGDELLRQLSAMLDNLVRKSDVLARLGGDEFGVFLYNCSVAVALKLANQIRSEVENFQFLWEGNRFQVGVSVGLVIVDDRWENLNALFSAADSACYLAKNEGRNRVVVYRDGDGHTSNRKIEVHWVDEINEAIDENRVVIALQEMVSLRNQREGTHFEVFNRIRSRSGEIIQPGAYLPSAERYGLATKLDSTVIDLTLNWLKQDPRRLQTIKMCSINLSSSTFANEEFATTLIEHIQSSGVPPSKLCFELTETATIANLSAASSFMYQLNGIGCQFMLDDFGSGLSSFAYLKKLPVAYLKIDGLLVKDVLEDPIDFTMVKAINEISQSIGQQTIAKHVESPELLEAVRQIGVDFAQGFELGAATLV